MTEAFHAVLEHGGGVKPSKGSTRELCGVTLELTNPRARLSRTEGRGKPFSCLGELCWYLSGSNAAEPIAYYARKYRKFAEDGAIFGGYGPRLFAMREVNQVQNVIDLLKVKPSSRRAAIQLFNAEDLAHDPLVLPDGHKDIPCTCTLQFLVRSGRLHMVTFMRSNDVWTGLPHDLFCFTMLQEIVARSVSVELGTYTHMVGSFHLYDNDETKARRALGEGWQSTQHPMPAMPAGDPWPMVRELVRAEREVRETGSLESVDIGGLDPFWADLVRLLLVYSYWKRGRRDRITTIRSQVVSSIYCMYVDQIAARP